MRVVESPVGDAQQGLGAGPGHAAQNPIDAWLTKIVLVEPPIRDGICLPCFLGFCHRVVCEIGFALHRQLLSFVHLFLLATEATSGKVVTDDHNASHCGQTLLCVQFAIAHLP